MTSMHMRTAVSRSPRTKRRFASPIRPWMEMNKISMTSYVKCTIVWMNIFEQRNKNETITCLQCGVESLPPLLDADPLPLLAQLGCNSIDI